MKNCVKCHKPLENPIDEFGDPENPKCQHCFLEDQAADEAAEKLRIEQQEKDDKNQLRFL